MLESDTIVVDEVDHVPEDEDSTLRHNALPAHAWPYSVGYEGRVFFGAFSMPSAENLIPLRI